MSPARALREHWPEYLIEGWALGCFMLSAAFFTLILEHPGSPLRAALGSDLLRRAGIGLAMGLTAIALIYSPWGKRSGAHMNPAVTLTFLHLGKVARVDALFYVVAQFAGGLAGVWLASAVAGAAFSDPPVSFIATRPGAGGVGLAFAAEAAISFGLMLMVLVFTNRPRLAPFTGLAAGALVAAYITVEAPLSGMSMNPARSLASALPASQWSDLWLYFTAPLLGMLAAAESWRAGPAAGGWHAPSCSMRTISGASIAATSREAIQRYGDQTMKERYDLIVVGSGAGGSAVAYKAVRAGARVLMLERGGRLPRDGSTLDVKRVFKDGAFKNRQGWVDGQNRSFVPGEFHNVGGKTKWYGAALLRFSPHEFEADDAHQCLPWPFGYEQLAPYYDEAERLLAVTRFDDEPGLKALIGKVTADGQWRAQPLPLGLDRGILDNEREAKHFDGFASPGGFKSDAERSLLDLIAAAPGFRLETGKRVSHLLPSRGDAARIAGVRCEDGSTYQADAIVLAAGAMTSPRILQDYFDDTGFGGSLPSAPWVGANFKMHLNSAVLGFSPYVDTDVLRKTAILFNDAYPHSTVQCLGWIDGEILGAQLPAAVPKFVLRAAGSRAIGFFATTEDGSSAENRIVSCAGTGTPVMDYEVARIGPAWREHRALVRAFVGRLLHAGLAGVDKFMGMAGTAHALGSLVTGNDPATSVVDAQGLAHGFANLYVGDGSVLPRSSRVNPALTIYAWGLRLGEHLAIRHQGATRPAQAA